MRRWPIEIKVRGSTSEPPLAPALGPEISMSPNADQRPSNLIGLLSDLAKDPKQAVTIVMTFAGLAIVFTACFVIVLLTLSSATKGVRGISLRYAWPIGAGSASMVTFTTIFVRVMLKRLRSSQSDRASVDKPTRTPLADEIHKLFRKPMPMLPLPQPTTARVAVQGS